LATRAAASFRRQLLPSNLSRQATVVHETVEERADDYDVAEQLCPVLEAAD
jgi:hypothetical protein